MYRKYKPRKHVRNLSIPYHYRAVATALQGADGVNSAIVPLDAHAAALVPDDAGREALAERWVEQTHLAGQPWQRRNGVVEPPRGRAQQQLCRVDLLCRLVARECGQGGGGAVGITSSDSEGHTVATNAPRPQDRAGGS